MATETVKVEGYREFLRAVNKADRDTKRNVRTVLREVGDVVKVDAASRIADDLRSPKSARGLRTRVRQRGVEVEQSLRKTTGKRPDWGSRQMKKALIPALNENDDRIEREMEHAIDRIADNFERRP